MLNNDYLVLCKWNHRNRKIYESIGYVFTTYGDEFYVKPSDLLHTSSQFVEVICDYCGEKFLQKYNIFLAHKDIIPKDACKKCYSKKYKESIKKVYGVENVSQSAKIKEKKKATCMEHYGVEFPLQNKEIAEKTKNTNIERYGCEYIMQSESAKVKSKKSCIDKYGVPHPMQSSEVREKSENTMMSKYGVKNAFQSKEICEKIKQTNINKYGVSSYTKTEEYKEKYKATCMEKYGVEHTSKNEETVNKIVQSLYKHGNVKTSSQQYEIYNLLNDIYGNCELNKICGRCFLDCALVINGVLVDVEYDGLFWHKDNNKDRRRDEFIKMNGYKILRIKSDKNIPTKEELEQAIDILLNRENNFYEIYV